jgi:hypothetical protein
MDGIAYASRRPDRSAKQAPDRTIHAHAAARVEICSSMMSAMVSLLSFVDAG